MKSTLVVIVLVMVVGVTLTQGQIVSNTINTIGNMGRTMASTFFGSNRPKVFQGDSIIYSALNDGTQVLGNSQAIESALNFFTVIASSFGPLGVPYSLDFTLPSNMNSSYDYIIVGGGSAGATLAARLSEDSNNKVLLLEAGGQEDLMSVIPVTAFLLQKSHRDWSYESTPQLRAAKGLNRDRMPVPRGRLLGGGSAINYMLYVRGNRKDYDRWSELGAGNWSYADVFPYFVKSEDNQDRESDPGYHGTTGSLTVTPLQEPFPVDSAFLEGCRQYGLKIGDLNGADQEKFMYSRFTIRGGRRCSTARAFLGPASVRSNLHIVLFARANKVLFDSSKRAIGVEFQKDGRLFQVFTRREIILSAGALNTPQLLMLSGVGPADHLTSHGIPVIQNSPGVGSNLQDHAFTLLMYTTRFRTSFVYARIKSGIDIARYFINGRGSFASPGLNVIGFWRSPYAYDERPDIQIHELDYIPGGAFPNLALGYILNVKRDVLLKYMMPYSLRDGAMFAVTLVRPRSTGTVRLASSDPRVAPLIDHNLFADERDLKALVEGCKLVLNISSTPAMRSVDAKQFDTPLPPCDNYPFNSDAYLTCLVQTLTYTIYHPTSTCKMGADNDPMAVLDSNLFVRGVSNLRVCDASVMPEVPTGNTNAPTIMVGEVCADKIKGRKLRPALPPYQNINDLLSY